MRKALLTVIVMMCLLLTTAMAYAEDKLTYVDLAKVFDEYKKTKGYDKVLEQKQTEYEKKRANMIEQVKKLQQKLSLLSEEERESRKGELEAKITQLQEFDRDTTQDLRKQRDDKAQEIFKDIKEAINSYAKKQSLDLIFDQRALVFYDNKLNITEDILKILNK